MDDASSAAATAISLSMSFVPPKDGPLYEVKACHSGLVVHQLMMRSQKVEFQEKPMLPGADEDDDVATLDDVSFPPDGPSKAAGQSQTPSRPETRQYVVLGSNRLQILNQSNRSFETATERSDSRFSVNVDAIPRLSPLDRVGNDIEPSARAQSQHPL